MNMLKYQKSKSLLLFLKKMIVDASMPKTLFLSFLLLSCSNKDKTDIVVIEPAGFEQTDLRLSDFAEEITYIQCDTTKLFRAIFQCELTSEFVFISTGSELLKFSREGRFIEQIGSLGPGPEEYAKCLQFTIDKRGRRLFVLSSPYIISYSFDGKFLGRISIPDENNAINIRYMNNRFYCFSVVNATVYQNPYLWTVVDDSGNFIDAKKNESIHFESDEMSYRGNLSCVSDKSLLYWNLYNDTIFRINSDVDVAYLWGQGNFRITPERITNHSEESCLRPTLILDSHISLFIRYRMGGNDYINLYNKKKKRFQNHTGKSVPNDLDGGISFSPEEYCQIDDDEYFLQVSEAEEVKAAALLSDRPETVSWGKQIEEYDNDIIVLVKLKK